MRQRVRSAVLMLLIMVWAVNAMAETGIDYSQIAEDMEIMSALIDRALEEKFPDEYSAASLFRGFRGCQGIYLKGYGAVFVTSINLPVAERPEPQTEAPEDDAWQRMKQDLRGTPTAAPGLPYGHPATGGSYNPEKVEELKKQLLELIGAYGSNIRQLGSQESIVIAMRGMSSSGMRFEDYVERIKVQTEELKKMKEVLQEKGKVLQKEGKELQKEAEQLSESRSKELQDRMEEPSKEVLPSSGMKAVVATPDVRVVSTPDMKLVLPSTGLLIGTSTIGGTRDYTTMIVKASREDILAYKNGELNFGGFMERAEVIQY